jgi:uncharacterized membrane protein
MPADLDKSIVRYLIANLPAMTLGFFAGVIVGYALGKLF